MKSPYVAELQADQTISTFFLVSEKEIRSTRDARPYLRLELADRTGTIEARMWEGFERDAQAVERDAFVKVQGRVENYRGKLQLSIDKMRLAKPGEVEAADFQSQPEIDVEAMYAKLLEYVAGVANPWLRQLIEDVVRDPEIAPKLKRAPAAKMMHHAYLGGLLDHVLSLCALTRLVAPHYPEVDGDLLLAGAILHDVGKTEELRYDSALGYTSEGQLLGHILIAYELLAKKMDAIAGFPPKLKSLVLHLLASHHGHYEFGSPKLPMFREALLLHYLDDMDSKMGAAKAALASEHGVDEWTEWNSALDRRLLRVDQYLKPEPEKK
jgi:3'-5' exoribonuclease